VPTPPRVEKWEPPAAAAPAAGSETPARPPSRSLADDLLMFAAEGTVSLAARHEQSIGEAPSIVSVVTAEQIRVRGLRTLADLMKTLPGFETSRDVRGFWRVAVRGLRSDPGILVLYDGRRLNNPWDGRVLWELPLAGVERVEVVRGPGGALYGTGAFLAVVNMVPSNEPGYELRADAGSFGRYEGSGRAARQFGPVLVALDADGGVRDGYRKSIQRDYTTKNLDQPAGITDDSRTGWGAGVRALWQPPMAGATVRAGVRVQNESRGALVGAFDVVGPGSKLGWTTVLADLAGSLPVGPWTLSTRLYLDWHDVDRTLVVLPPGYVLLSRTYAFGVQERMALSVISEGMELSGSGRIFEGNQLTVGVQVEGQSLGDFSMTANVQGDEPTPDGAMVAEPGPFPATSPAYNSRKLFGLFLQDEWRIAAPLTLTTGLRLDSMSAVDGWQADPRLGLVWRPPEVEGLAAKLLVSRAFRAPTYEELLTVPTLSGSLVAGQYAGNLKLQAVTVTTLEAGLELTRPLGEGRVSARANAFWSAFENPIEALDDTGSNPVWVNRDKGERVWGAEAEARYDWPGRSTLWANVAWVRARDSDVDANTPDFSLLADVPQLRANLGLQLPVGPWLAAGLEGAFGSERRNNARTTLEATRRYRIPAYGLVGFSLRTTRLWNHWEAAAYVRNLTDLAYFDDVPRPDATHMPGLLPREGVSCGATLRMVFP